MFGSFSKMHIFPKTAPPDMKKNTDTVITGNTINITNGNRVLETEIKGSKEQEITFFIW
jgi:hypothetical protein